MQKDILYTTDQRYLDFTLASILSLYVNSKLDNIKIHLITENFSHDDKRRVMNFFDNLEILYQLYDLKTLNINQYDIPNWRGTQIANARLFFQSIIGDAVTQFDSLLYLDADTIVVSDLNGIYDHKTKTINAVLDGGNKRYYECDLGLSEYFNSGVLLFDVQNWLKNDYEKRLVEYQKSNQLKLTYPDQDLLNLTFKNEIGKIPINYNMLPHAYLYQNTLGKIFFSKHHRAITYEDVIRAYSSPCILHAFEIFGIKPWSNNTIHPYHEVFMDYISEVNNDFQMWQLNRLQKFFNNNPTIYKLTVIAKIMAPKIVEDQAKKLSRKYHEKS